MNTRLSLASLAGLLTLSVALNAAEPAAAPTDTAAPAAASAPAPKKDARQGGINKRVNNILNALALQDPAKTAQVRALLEKHYGLYWDWHQANDAKLKELWAQFKAARNGEKDKAAGFLKQIRDLYATFKPEHDAFLTQMGAQVSPEQINKMKDAITIGKLDFTYNGYLVIFPDLKDADKAFVRAKLTDAREDSFDAGSVPEMSDIFKAYKDQIEAYLNSHDLNVKQHYEEYSRKAKAAKAAKAAAQGEAKAPAAAQ